MTKPPNPPKKTRSAAIVAATCFNRIEAIDLDEAAELRQSPETIRNKHAARRAAAMAALSPEARVILDGMLATKAKSAGKATE